jgi:anaerobic selenocysteine-containing dehydrogenase
VARSCRANVALREVADSRYSRGVVSTSYATCPLCEATCGIAVDHEGPRILRIRGDRQDPLSRGYICPKAAALADVHGDPDRIRRPLRRIGDRWHEIGWAEALDEAAERLGAIQRQHGRDAVAVYVGNPTVHSYSALLFGPMFLRALGTRQLYTANSVDGLPRLLSSWLEFGSQTMIPIPDIDRTDFMVIIGANPAVSNGSHMTAPDCERRLRDIRKRGGRIVVIDPRRSETAALAGR